MGFMHYDPKPMERTEAAELLKRTTYFDYLKGRVMKSDLSGDDFDPQLYDRDNGDGAAARVIEELRKTLNPNSPSIQEAHSSGTVASATHTRDRLSSQTEVSTKDGVPVFSLGLSDVAHVLGPKVNEAIKHKNQ